MDSATAALIGAAIGFTGGLLQKTLDFRAERARWRRARRDEVFRDTHRAAGDLAAKIAELAHLTMWFTYSMNETNKPYWKEINDKFDAEAHSLIAAVKGAEIRVVTMDKALRDTFKPLVSEAILLSEEADEARQQLVNDKSSEALMGVNQRALSFIKRLPEVIADTMSESKVERAA